MKVVSNSSVLIALSGIGRLEILHQRFPEGVIVPDAVWIEVVETGQHLGIRCLGLIGVLVEAKRRDLIDQVKPAIVALRDVAGFRISQTLFDRVIADLGEA